MIVQIDSLCQHYVNCDGPMTFLDKPLMQNAQIWKSMEALCDEAEAVARASAPGVAVIESTAPPALSQQKKSASAPTEESSKNSTVARLSALQGLPAPPIAILEKHHFKNHTDGRESLAHIDAKDPVTPAKMEDIAAAIEQIAKGPPLVSSLPRETSLDDHVRQQLIGEVSQAVRAVLATELPKMVRHALSESLYDLTITNDSTHEAGVVVGQPPQKANRKKSTSKKPIAKKAAAKKSAPKKTIIKRTTAKKAAAKKSASKNVREKDQH